MPNSKEYRRHIQNVKNTEQITNAMKMTAAAKLKKAHSAVICSRPYDEKMREVVHRLMRMEHPVFPLAEKRDLRRVGLVLITGNWGLSGGYNGGLTRFADQVLSDWQSKGVEAEVVAVGSKGYSYMLSRGSKLYEDCFFVSDMPLYDEAVRIANDLCGAFLAGAYDRVDIVYQAFHSAGRQAPALRPLLPVAFDPEASAEHKEYLYDPNSQTVLDYLIPQYINSALYQAVLESKASEHAARVMAMSAASDNANKMISKLVLSYNRARQAAITREISEIVGGANAIQ